MEFVYHGSKIKGLTIITPKPSTHQKEWVYATPSKAAAIIFISNGGSDLYYELCGCGSKESPLVLVERKEGVFNELFCLSGSLYTLQGKNFQSGMTGWDAEVVSEFEEMVNGEEIIDNVLTKLEELSASGELQLYRYPNRPNSIPLDNSDLIPRIVTWVKRGYDVHKFLAVYPELETKLNEQMSGSENKNT